MVAQLRQRRSRLAQWSVRLGLLAVPVMVLAGLGHRFGVLDTPATFVVIAVSVALALAAVIAAVSALLAIWRKGDEGTGAAVRGLILGAVVLSVPLYAAFWLMALPRLSDISTDPENPPRFTIAAINRPASANPVLLPSPDQIAAQRSAYPHLASRLYPVDTGVVFNAALALVNDRRWQVLDLLEPVNAGEPGRIEATARTLLFAFKDDVVVVMTGEADGTRVDMRSASQYGRHDLGTNARRIQDFLDDLDAALAAGS